MKLKVSISTPSVQSSDNRGFSLVEALLSVAVFALVSTGLIFALIYLQDNPVLSGNRLRATLLAEEGIEALNNLSENSFANLTAGTYGIVMTSTQFALSGTSSTIEIFNRQAIISTIDTDRKAATVTVSWLDGGQVKSISLARTFTNWRKSKGGGGGLLVHGNGGTVSDLITYRLLSADTQTWSATSSAADIDAGSTNRAVRALRVYASATRNEKIIISRHFDGTTQYIYAQVYNGDTNTWGNVQLLASWNATTFLDVQNFDGAYLANGDFMAVYSDNTVTPKFQIWNGSTWSVASISMQSSGGIPTYIVAKARPGTDEVMAAVFDQSSDTNTQYYDGVGYTTADWTAHTEHTASAVNNTNWFLDFAWNGSNPLYGGLTYSNATNNRGLRIKVFTADGAGGGSWGSVVSGSNQGTGSTRLNTLALAASPLATYFLVCDRNTTSQIVCQRSAAPAAWTTPANNTITTATDTGNQRSYHLAYEILSGNAIVVYSDNTATPKLKKYNAAGNSFDAAATSLTAMGAGLKTVRMMEKPSSDDLMIVMADGNNNLYSVVWDGTNDLAYLTPAGLAWTNQAASGSATTDFFYDFAWDAF